MTMLKITILHIYQAAVASATQMVDLMTDCRFDTQPQINWIPVQNTTGMTTVLIILLDAVGKANNFITRK